MDGIDDPEHPLVLVPLRMVAVENEDDVSSRVVFSEIAQVHEGMLRKRGEIGISQLHEELGIDLIENARVGAQGFVALESEVALNKEGLEFTALESKGLDEGTAGEF